MTFPLQIVVFLKQVADNTKLKFADGMPVFDSAAQMMNPFDEYALETAIRLKEVSPESQLTAITIGAPGCKEMLKKAIAVGVDQAFIIHDDALAGKDSAALSTVLAGAVKKLVPGFSVLLFGQTALDDASGQAGPRVAELLGIASLTSVKEAVSDSGVLRVSRETEHGVEVHSLSLPAAVCTIKCDYELRGSNIKGVMKANKTEIPVHSVSDLGLSADSLVSPTAITKTWQRPAKSGGQILIGVDNAAAVSALVEFLKTRQLV